MEIFKPFDFKEVFTTKTYKLQFKGDEKLLEIKDKLKNISKIEYDFDIVLAGTKYKEYGISYRENENISFYQKNIPNSFYIRKKEDRDCPICFGNSSDIHNFYHC